MAAFSFDALVESVRFSSLLMSPVCGGTNDALALQLERLANVAATLADRPGSPVGRSIALEAAYHRAGMWSLGSSPKLQAHEHPGWVLTEATAAIEMIERCRGEIDFPIVLDDLLIDLRVELDAFTHARNRAA